MRTHPPSWFTHLQLAQLFISLLASTLSQKEHWIGMMSEPKERGCCSSVVKGLGVSAGDFIEANYIFAVGRCRQPRRGNDIVGIGWWL